jgi:Domain of unknown function (DUF4954)
LNYLSKKSIASWKEVPPILGRDSQKGSGAWVDLAGLLTPKSQSDLLLAGIVSGSIKSIEEIDSVLGDLYSNYSEFEFLWAIDKLKAHFGLDASTSPKKFSKFVENWESASNSIYVMMQEDLMKEFSNYMTVGFGLDNPGEKEQDIIAVRGKWEENPIAETIQELIAQTKNIALKWESIII